MAAEAIAPPKEAEEAEKVTTDYCLGVHCRDNMMSRSNLYDMLYHNWL